MTPQKKQKPTLEQLVADIASQVRQANLKLDHVIYQVSDDYYRQFYELYGRHLEG